MMKSVNLRQKIDFKGAYRIRPFNLQLIDFGDNFELAG